MYTRQNIVIKLQTIIYMSIPRSTYIIDNLTRLNVLI